MKWEGRQRSSNVEDRRGMGPKAAIGGGGIGVLLLAVVIYFLGGEDMARQLMQQNQVAQQQPAGNDPSGPADDKTREFIEVVLYDTETIWGKLFDQHVDGDYVEPKLEIFSGQVRSMCGLASSDVGPFYCPADQKIYIDPTFFDQLAKRHQAPGDFAQAYVIAHEVAHHVQRQLGYGQIVDKIRARGNEMETNQASVRLELQADFLAGVWAHHAHKEYGILEPGDIQEAIQAANQIGDDTLQKEAMGYVVPERYTHGTSAQRVKWFTNGIKSGDLRDAEILFKIPYTSL